MDDPRLVFAALARLPAIPDPMPADVLDAEGLTTLDLALRHVHFPEDDEQARAARSSG